PGSTSPLAPAFVVGWIPGTRPGMTECFDRRPGFSDQRSGAQRRSDAHSRCQPKLPSPCVEGLNVVVPSDPMFRPWLHLIRASCPARCAALSVEWRTDEVSHYGHSRPPVEVVPLRSSTQATQKKDDAEWQ